MSRVVRSVLLWGFRALLVAVLVVTVRTLVEGAGDPGLLVRAIPAPLMVLGVLLATFEVRAGVALLLAGLWVGINRWGVAAWVDPVGLIEDSRPGGRGIALRNPTDARVRGTLALAVVNVPVLWWVWLRLSDPRRRANRPPA